MTSSSSKGAASSAAPTALPEVTTPEQAEKLLRAATRPEQAWAIYEISAEREGNWRAVKLMAERRYGELLGEAEQGAPKGNANARKNNVTSGHVVSDVERKVQSRARKVAAVPREDFDAYLADEEKPTREGLLRRAAPKTEKAEEKATKQQQTRGVGTDANVIAWVEARRREGMVREQIVKASRERSDYPGATVLSNGSLGTIDAILHDRKNFGRTQQAKKGPTWGGKRKRSLYEEIRFGNDTALHRLMIDISDAVRKLEHMVLPEDVGLTEESQEMIRTLFEDLIMLQEWVATAVTATMGCMTDLKQQQKILKARVQAQDRRTPEHERRAAQAAVERLEAAYRAKRLNT